MLQETHKYTLGEQMELPEEVSYDTIRMCQVRFSKEEELKAQGLVCVLVVIYFLLNTVTNSTI